MLRPLNAPEAREPRTGRQPTTTEADVRPLRSFFEASLPASGIASCEAISTLRLYFRRHFKAATSVPPMDHVRVSANPTFGPGRGTRCARIFFKDALSKIPTNAESRNFPAFFLRDGGSHILTFVRNGCGSTPSGDPGTVPAGLRRQVVRFRGPLHGKELSAVH